MTILVNNLFYSVQGEGPFIGYPMIFIRLTGCSLRCVWCDSKVAWDEGTEMTVEEIIGKIKEYPCKNICLTGGESLLQQQSLIKLVEKLNGKYTFHFETNGTIEPIDPMKIGYHIISPKLKSSGNENAELAPYYKNEVCGYFKFVISDEEDLEEMQEFLDKNNIHESNKIYLMPEGVTVERQQEILPKLISFVKSHPEREYIVTPRLHILAYGNKRGV